MSTHGTYYHHVEAFPAHLEELDIRLEAGELWRALDGIEARRLVRAA